TAVREPVLQRTRAWTDVVAVERLGAAASAPVVDRNSQTCELMHAVVGEDALRRRVGCVRGVLQRAFDVDRDGDLVCPERERVRVHDRAVRRRGAAENLDACKGRSEERRVGKEGGERWRAY